jgi:predicted small metal-binding protein
LDASGSTAGGRRKQETDHRSPEKRIGDRRIVMSKTISCRDAGVDCDFIARADSEEELFKICERHAKKSHDMKSIPPELKTKMRQYIRDE